MRSCTFSIELSGSGNIVDSPLHGDIDGLLGVCAIISQQLRCSKCLCHGCNALTLSVQGRSYVFTKQTQLASFLSGGEAEV